MRGSHCVRRIRRACAGGPGNRPAGPFTGSPDRPFANTLPFVSGSYFLEREHKRDLRPESAQKDTAIGRVQLADQEDDASLTGVDRPERFPLATFLRHGCYPLHLRFGQPLAARGMLRVANGICCPRFHVKQHLFYYKWILSFRDSQFAARCGIWRHISDLRGWQPAL